MKLYEAADALAEVEWELWESGGELTEEVERALMEVAGAFDEKAERVALKVRELETEAEGVRAEAVRLAERASRLEKGARSLKEYLRLQMTRVERPRIDGRLVTLRLQNSPPSVLCQIPAEELPLAYQRISVAANSKALLEAWRGGEELPQGVLVKQDTHLRIV